MTDERVHPTARRILVAAVVSVWAMAWTMAWAPGALAAGAGITGTVVNGTTEEPVGGLEVTLHLLTQQSELGTLTATTGEDGTFSFPAASAGAEGYQVTAVYKGTLYSSQATQITQGEQPPVTLSVYEKTTDPSDVRQTSWIVWIDREGSGAAVQHDLEWKNSGTAAYVGDQTAPDGSPIVTQVPLAPGATNLQFLGTYLATAGQVVGSVFVHPQPIVPGTSTATIRYSVAELTELSLPITLPTDEVQMFVPSGVEVVPNGLAPAGTYSDQTTGTTYQVFTATDLKSGDTLGVTLKGLVGGGPSPFLVVIVGTVVVAVIGALALWWLRRPRAADRNRPARRGAARGTATTQKAEGRTAGRNGRRTGVPARTAPADTRASVSAAVGGEPEGEDEFDLLIEEIAALDLSYERGLLDQRTYESLRAAAKRRLQRMRGVPTQGRPAR
jgi:hypothetical protein